MPDAKYREQIMSSLNEWGRRHAQILSDRDIRYGRTDVLSMIPVELQSTDFEYHSMDLNDAVMDLASFMSASEQTWTVSPARDNQQGRADDIESVLAAVFGHNGVLEMESGGEVGFMVWQNQVDPSGQGIYKFTLKRDYPLRMPKRKYGGESHEDYEDNPDYAPRSRRDGREQDGTTRYRETDGALAKRRDGFMRDEFPWQWRSVDPAHYFEITQDGVVVCAGEYAARSVARLDSQDDVKLADLGKEYTYISAAGEDGNSGQMVNVLEYWTATHGYLCFTSSDKKTVEESRSWSHPYGRVPYYHADGLMTNDHAIETRYAGAFTNMLSEITLLDYLETMHFNAIHRGFFPMYVPVKDPRFRGEVMPMESEQLIAVTSADRERTELPPGYRWEVMPTGFEPDLRYQLTAARERVKDSAIAAVLAGRSSGAGDSGAKISLLINAATRNIDPFRRHHAAALIEMAETMLRISKRLKLDLHVSTETHTDTGSRLVRALSLRATDIVSTSVQLSLNTHLPVDEAALEVRGMTLISGGMKSYQSAAPEFFRVGDPIKEKERIAIERREQQIDDVAFQQAVQRFTERAPAIYAEFFQNVAPLAPATNTVGGGPAGTYGGAAAQAGRGGPALPGATQVDMGGA